MSTVFGKFMFFAIRKIPSAPNEEKSKIVKGSKSVINALIAHD